MGYSIDQLKKTGTLEGNDTIPVMQGGLTKQVAAGILNNAKIITAAGSQASGIIRREMTYILKNNSSAINFTLNNAVGKKVVNNDYSDDAATATGWIVKVMNVSTRSHVVIVGSNSWDIAKNENMYFFWTGSAWTLHNARMNNVIIDGELKLPNAAAVTSLQATSKLAGLDANGKVNYTTPDAIKSALSLATTTDLANLFEMKALDKDTYAECMPTTIKTTSVCCIAYNKDESNRPQLSYNYIVTSTRYNTSQGVQIAQGTSDGANFKPVCYIRFMDDNVFTDWQKLTTETDLNNTVKNYKSHYNNGVTYWKLPRKDGTTQLSYFAYYGGFMARITGQFLVREMLSNDWGLIQDMASDDDYIYLKCTNGFTLNISCLSLPISQLEVTYTTNATEFNKKTKRTLKTVTLT